MERPNKQNVSEGSTKDAKPTKKEKEFLKELIEELFSFFDSLAKNKDIFQELPIDKSESIKEDRYTSLYNLLSKIYKKYQISNVDLRPSITLYLNNL